LAPPDRRRRAGPGSRASGAAPVRRRRQPPVPHHEPDPARAARRGAASPPSRADGPARGRGADRGETRSDELPLRLRPVPRGGPRALPRLARGVRAGPGGRIGGDRARATERLGQGPGGTRSGAGGRLLAARPGRFPGAAQDAPERARSPTARRRTTPAGRARVRRDRAGPQAADVSGGRMDRTPSSASTVSDPTHRLTPVVRIAPAKVNLTLAVVGRRPDGFHAIHSVMAPLALADR